MRTLPGEILNTDGAIEPRLGSVYARKFFIQRALRRHHSKPLKHLHPRGAVVEKPSFYARGAVVKVWQTSSKTSGQHLSYLARDSHGAELFTHEHQEVRRQEFIRAAQSDGHQHRMIISVVDHAQVDLQQLARNVVRQLEQDIGARVHFIGSIHRSTAHPHIHLVIRGMDTHGRALHFTHDYRRRGLRYQVQHLLTRQLGPSVRPVDHLTLAQLEGWAESHVQEQTGVVFSLSTTGGQVMEASVSESPESQEIESSRPIDSIAPRRLTTVDAQRRIEEARRRMVQQLEDMKARGLRAHLKHARSIEPSTSNTDDQDNVQPMRSARSKVRENRQERSEGMEL